MAKFLIAQGVQLKGIQGLGGYDPDTSSDVTSYASALETIISNSLAVMSIVGGIMFMIYFLTGGITWITAGGDQSKIEQAQKKMTGAAIGLIIIGLSYSLAYIISTVLGFEVLNPAQTIQTLVFN